MFSTDHSGTASGSGTGRDPSGRPKALVVGSSQTWHLHPLRSNDFRDGLLRGDADVPVSITFVVSAGIFIAAAVAQDCEMVVASAGAWRLIRGLPCTGASLPSARLHRPVHRHPRPPPCNAQGPPNTQSGYPRKRAPFRTTEQVGESQHMFQRVR